MQPASCRLGRPVHPAAKQLLKPVAIGGALPSVCFRTMCTRWMEAVHRNAHGVLRWATPFSPLQLNLTWKLAIRMSYTQLAPLHFWLPSSP